jgi:hypothetical protein
MSLSDEINVQFDAQGPPDFHLAECRTKPPKALRSDGYELVDESFNSLTFEKRYLDWPQKILIVTTLGLALIFKGWMESVFRLTLRFAEQGSGTRVTIHGTTHPKTAAALHELVAEHGGATGPPTPSMSSTLLPGSPSS